ncbi:MAG TPA: sulfatase-like hydrolase/transferase [Vicinamibacteria bacterium]|nr:sulfatase-like hydrolase/transferase [Vicinamibacteria bacterium]
MSARSRRRTRAAEGPPTARPSRLAWWAVAAAVVVLAAASSWLALRRATPRPAAQARLNLLLVTLDTTRADRLGCYGYAAGRTRYLDQLAAEGVRFQQASSPAPITLPAHSSILTGLYPFAHGVRNNGNFYLADRFPTLATVLKAQGYRTAAFVSSFILDRRYGLARGFDTYDDAMEGAQSQVVALEAERRGDRTALALSRWLEQTATAERPFFAWLHLYDPHEPYRPPPPFRDLFASDPYQGEIVFDDAVVASVLDTLQRTGALDRTVVAVIGDHGESLGDHGEETHSMFVYESALRVPLILWRPGRLPAGRVLQEPVRATDLAPTLLELLGAPALRTNDGVSLLPLIEGRSLARTPPVYAETYLPLFYMNWAPLRAIRDARFKLIDAPRPELYDLERDPGEQQNLYAAANPAAASLRSALDRLTAGGQGAMEVGRLDRETAEKLASLGYLGAEHAGSDVVSGAARPEPQEMIAVFNRLRRANSAVRERRFAEAVPVLREVLARDPRNAFATLVSGSAQMGMGHWREAVAFFRRYLELVPTSAYAHHWIAICALRSGDKEAALREAEATLAIDPHFSDARILKAGVLATRGAYDEAVAELRQAVETDPGKPAIRLDLARVLAEAGHPDEARKEYAALLATHPNDAAALTGRAALDASAGDLAAAERGLRRALAIEPDLDEARADLAQVLERTGRRGEALAEYRRLADSSSPAVRARARQALASASR